MGEKWEKVYHQNGLVSEVHKANISTILMQLANGAGSNIPESLLDALYTLEWIKGGNVSYRSTIWGSPEACESPSMHNVGQLGPFWSTAWDRDFRELYPSPLIQIQVANTQLYEMARNEDLGMDR